MDKWQEIKKRLEHLGGSVDLIADGCELGLRKVHDGKRIFVSVYVNGYIKAKWIKADDDGRPVHPEARFWRPMKKAAWSKKDYRDLRKIWGKRKADAMITPRVVAFVPDFGTEGSVVAHLKKHFPDLEIKQPEGATA